VRTIVEELVEVQREVLERQRRFRLMLQLSEEVLPVRVDRMRLEQVLSIDNAMKYSPEGGLIAVEVQKQGDEAQITITDSGIGIPHQDLSKVFSPFFRASNASSRHFAGVGLGLYLCQSILQAHGGTIHVTSQEGQGSTFFLSLPLVGHSAFSLRKNGSQRQSQLNAGAWLAACALGACRSRQRGWGPGSNQPPSALATQ
jgi:signal transduction histidine kinase